MKSKHISAIPLPGITPQTDDTTPLTEDADYLTELKVLTDEKVKNNPSEFGIEYDYVRHRFCREAKTVLGREDSPTLQELDHCFPDYDHTEWIQKCKDGEKRRQAEQAEAGKPQPRTTQAPTRGQVEARLNNPPATDTDEIKLSKKDWEWLEKANHPLGGRLFYGCGITPLFMELDLKLGISDSPHRRRLLDYLGLHCDLKTGITSEVTVGELSDKLQCGKDKIREGIKWLVKREVLEYSENYAYPEHYTTGVVFVLPFVREAHEVKAKANGLRTKTGIAYRELWERREEFGFGVKSGGECEAEGVRPPSSS